MDNAIKDIITQSVSETLENLAFIFASPEEEDVTFEDGEAAICQVFFSGPFNGLIRIHISHQCLPELASNMLGYDDPSQASSVEQKEALKETTNIICGNLLPVIFDPQAVFQVNPPEIIDSGEFPNARMELKSEVALILDEGQCLIQLFAEGHVSFSPKGASEE